MNELITVNYDNDRPTVLGRDLHEKLEVGTPYHKWFPRMCEYGFTETIDYITVDKKVRRADGAEMPQIQTDHQLTIDMAKQLCMLQRSDAGKRYREYFLEIERKWNDPVTSMARSLVYANRQLASVTGQLEAANKKIEKLEPKAAYFDTVASADGSTSFRETAKLFKIAEKTFTKFIEENNLCYRDSRKRLIPYAERQKSGWFEVKEVTITTSTGIKTTIYTKITPKGRTEIFKRLQTAGVIKPWETEVIV